MSARTKDQKAFQVALQARTPYLWAQIDEILLWLTIGYMPVFARPSKKTSSAKLAMDPSQAQTGLWVEVDREMALRLGVLLQYRFKQLAKTLPDQRAIEFQDLTEKTDVTRDNLPVLQQRLRSILALEQASSPARTLQ